MVRDLNAARQPGAEKPLERPLVDDAIELPEYAADLSQEELEKLVHAIRQRKLAKRLPDDVPGIGTRR